MGSRIFHLYVIYSKNARIFKSSFLKKVNILSNQLNSMPIRSEPDLECPIMLLYTLIQLFFSYFNWTK